MSEYHFDYHVVSEAGRKENRIRFFFARSYDAMGMRIQVCVPEEIYAPFHHVRVRYAYDAVALPKTLIANLGDEAKKLYAEEIIPIHRDKPDANAFFLSDLNGFYLTAKDGNFACTGELAFFKTEDPSENPEEGDVYQFAVNFAKKETIRYQIREIDHDGEKKDRLEISVLYPRLFEDIELRVYSKENSKPILRGDFAEEHVIPPSRYRRPMVLTKFERDSRLAVFEVSPGEDVFTHNYRLGFAKPEVFEPFYFLSDESEFTSEDQARREKEFAAERKKHRAESPLCPYCGRPIAKGVLKAKSGVFHCDGRRFPHSLKAPGNDAKGKYVFCGNEPNKRSEGAITAEKPLLPEGYGTRPVATISVAGAPECGKTTFLASLFDMAKTGIHEYSSNPAILDEIMRAFVPKRRYRPVTEVKMLDGAFPAVSYEEIELDDAYEIARSEGLQSSRAPGNAVNVKGRYAFHVNGDFESNTKAVDELVLSYNPIAYALGDSGYAYFYDVPGEMFAESSPEPVRCLGVSNSLIVLVDGDPEVGVDEDAEVENILLDILKAKAVDKALGKKIRDYLAEDDLSLKRGLAATMYPELEARGDAFASRLSQYKDHMLLEPKPGTKKSPLRKLQKTFENLVTLFGDKASALSSMPIAIVFSKLDSRLFTHEGKRRGADAWCFDANTHITHENMIPLYPRNHRYAGSDVERHINNASYEIEEYLRSWPDGPAVIDGIRANCQNVKFFACSALGGADVLQQKETSSVKKIMYRPRPIRMELPIIWIFKSLGIITR